MPYEWVILIVNLLNTWGINEGSWAGGGCLYDGISRNMKIIKVLIYGIDQYPDGVIMW